MRILRAFNVVLPPGPLAARLSLLEANLVRLINTRFIQPVAHKLGSYLLCVDWWFRPRRSLLFPNSLARHILRVRFSLRQ